MGRLKELRKYAPRIKKGKVRVWYKCKQCKIIEYTDMVWYPLANPHFHTSCKHKRTKLLKVVDK